MNNLIDDFSKEIECNFENEKYTVRDNGAVMRHPKEGGRKRLLDNTWTFGKVDEKTGYMLIAGVRVHRIVATVFHGGAPTKEHIVDHILQHIEILHNTDLSPDISWMRTVTKEESKNCYENLMHWAMEDNVPPTEKRGVIGEWIYQKRFFAECNKGNHLVYSKTEFQKFLLFFPSFNSIQLFIIS